MMECIYRSTAFAEMQRKLRKCRSGLGKNNITDLARGTCSTEDCSSENCSHICQWIIQCD